MSDDGRVDGYSPVLAEPGREIYRFPNNYGASVIEPHGHRELAVVWFDDNNVMHLVHPADIAPDVVSIRSTAHLVELLDRIAALPA